MAQDLLQRVSDQVYRLEDRYVNVYLLDLGKVALVDTGTKMAGPRIRAGLRELGKEPDDVAVLLLTHHHVDHTGTAAAWRREVRAQADIHELDAPVAAGREHRRMHGRGAKAKVFTAFMGLFVPLLRTPPVRADRVLKGGEAFDVLGWPIEVIHAPGHTLGSSAFYARPADVLFVGDAVNGRQGVPDPPRVAEDPEAALDSYRRLTAHPASLLLPGHGSPIRRRRLDPDASRNSAPQS